MGCDIHSAVEVFDGEKWSWIKDIEFAGEYRSKAEPFDWRHYNMFCFIADVYCRSNILEHLSSYKGLPIDLSEELNQNRSKFWLGDFGFGWLLLSEIIQFNYDKELPIKVFNDAKTYKEMLGPMFFDDIAVMKKLNTDYSKIRIVFGFDN